MADLNDLFGEDPYSFEPSTSKNHLSSAQRTKNCAGDIGSFPPLPRQQSNFVGLVNQTATCYLNSLFQSLFMTPQFRQAILSLPLCEGSSLDTPSEFIPAGKKRNILFAIQKLFVMLQEEDTRDTTTEELTKAFGWNLGEEGHQQDVSELNKVLFNAIEQTLSGTVYDTLIEELYCGLIKSVRICQKCGNSRGNEEKFWDLQILLKHYDGYQFAGVMESLRNHYFEMEKMEGVFCDICNDKTETLRGNRLQRLPPVLTMTLSRFEMDWATETRKKLNERFEYPLELNLSEFLNVDAIESPENCDYELKSVIIHSGGAFGGHYHAYIKDSLKEGNWHLQMPAEFSKDPSVVEKKAFIPENYMTQEQIKKAEEDKLKEEFDVKIPMDDTAPVQGISKKQQKRNKQGGNQQQQNKGNKGQKQGKKQKGEKKEEKKETIIEYEYDQCDFPIPYSEKRLIEGWFDFNDSSVNPILPGKLQKQFGGSSENAYMLVYVQKKFCKNAEEGEKPQIPLYWKEAIANINETNKQQRDFFSQMENQLDLILQDENLFIVDPESNFVSYVDPTKVNEQGMKARICFSDTIEQVKMKVAETIGTLDFSLFEVNLLVNGYCKLSQILPLHAPTTIVKDTKITHKSTWLIVKDKVKADKLSEYVGEYSEPINLRIRMYGEESTMKVYSNQFLDSFITHFESVSGIPFNQISMKVVEDTQIRRIDKSIYNATDPLIKNTLRDLKIVENSAILVEVKDEHEADGSIATTDVMNIDDTEFTRTVIASLDYEKENIQRFQINLNWTVKQLTDFLIDQMKIEGPRRLRNLFYDRLFIMEELDTQLKNYADFQEGGARVLVESGRSPSMSELTIRVVVFGKEEDLKHFYIPTNSTVLETKEIICKEFGIADPLKHTLFRVDYLEEPTYALRRNQVELNKCNVSSGELLVLKSDAEMLPEERVSINVSLTMTGQADDSQYLDVIVVNREYTINDLKEVILCMPQLEFAKAYPLEQIRLREKQRNMFFGKIFRDGTKTIKSLKIDQHSQIVIQVLQEPEVLDPNSLILLICRRQVQDRSYGQKVELTFRFDDKQAPLIKDLIAECRKFFSVPDDEVVSIAKYIPHQFEWKWMNEEEIITEKKKKKIFTHRAGDQDIRKMPFLLKDGDIIGVRFESENIDNQDNFQTLQDEEQKELFRVQKEEERIQNEKDKVQNKKVKRKNSNQNQLFIDLA